MTSVAIDGVLVSNPDDAGRGLGRYVDALLSSLVDVDGLDLIALMAGPRGLPTDVRRVDIRRRFRPPARLAWYEHIARIGRDARRVQPDVFHSPGLDPPLWYRGPWVQTLHDVIPLVYPSELWGPEVKRWRLRGRLMRRAGAVICISAHTADLAVQHLGLDASRLHVIHHGVTPIFRQRVAPEAADPPYVLYVGGFGPHKGFAEAFDVIARVADAGLPHRLRFVGGSGSAHGDPVDSIVQGARRPDRIDVLGQITDEELVRLYRGADALIVTSRYEGFGRPTIEALAAGTPVVSFDNSSLGEILGDGGVLVADGDVEAFAGELIAILRDDAARAELGHRALRRSEHFDWARCAAEHAEVYEAVRR